jgi:colicin import membrane protein
VRLVSDLDMGTMRKAAQAESSSVLFSLGELMKLEEQRIEEERHVVDAQRAAVERARVEAEARAAREQAMRLEAERARREAEERAAREEGARLEAMRAAAVERARIEAEEKARLAAMTAAQEHEKSLVALREDASKKRLSRWLGGSIAAAVLLAAGGLGLYFGKIQPEAEARERATAMQLEQARSDLDKAKRELEGRERAVEDLQRERDAATDARKKAELDAKIASEEIKIRELRGRGRLPPPIDDKKPIKKNCGNADDPLNPCL